MKKIWRYLNGNKTIICLILWSCIEAGLIPITGGWYILVKIILGALTGGSLVHHMKKGYFSKKKGD